MLTLRLPEFETENEVLPEIVLEMEHSLLSLSKWESKFEKAFFSNAEKTPEETVAYIAMMCTNVTPPEDVWVRFRKEDYEQINTYINSKQTATTFRQDPTAKKGPGELITNELIYYWLVSFKIPFYPTETWHINRVMTLVEVCGRKQTKPKKMSNAQRNAEYARLNAERRAALNSQG